mmetsp:Transcript_9136/g.22592  ORF Transcript_9136/g.22592 Transcript_9136/m.22592 type:complete len:293 (+) Transcript_9136:1-879(+)
MASAREMRRVFEEQLESVQALIGDEINQVRSKAAGRLEAGGGGGGDPSGDRSLEQTFALMQAQVEKFGWMLQERNANLSEEQRHHVGASAGGDKGEGDSSKAKRKLFSQGETVRRSAATETTTTTVGTQTDEPFSHYLHTAEAMESLTKSIVSKVTRHIDEHYMLPLARSNAMSSSSFSGGGVREEFRTSAHLSPRSAFPSTSRIMPSLKALSSPITEPIFTDHVIPPMPSSSSLDYPARGGGGRTHYSQSSRRKELAELMRSPIAPPFSKSPRSKGIRHSEYSESRRKHPI